MKILVTGGTGLVGRYLSKILKSENSIFLSRRDCDITSFPEVKDVFFRVKPDVVFHLAAFTDVDASEYDPVSALKTNVTGTNNIALMAGKTGSYVIYVSTDFVFSGEKKKKYTEKDQPYPLSIYGKTKFEGELIVSTICREYCIVRTSRVFGKDGRNFASCLPQKLLRKQKLMITTDLINSPTYAKDLAKALLDISSARFSGIIHFCNDGQCSWYDFGLYICELLRIDKFLLIPVSSKNFSSSQATRPDFSVLDTSLFSGVFYKPRSWQEAASEYIRSEIKAEAC